MKLKVVVFCVSVSFLASCGSAYRPVVNNKKPVVTNKKPVVVTKEKPVVVVKEKQAVIAPSIEVKEVTEKIVNKNPNLNNVTLDYIRNYAAIAVSEMHKNKIPASITLAQGILESGNGRSELASKSNNHFGIKCHSQWQGESVYHDDDEAGECFRKYKYVESSYKDHSAFLTNRSRYAFLFKYRSNDYKSWARGLRKAGYASDPKYPNKLIRLIETYSLHEFDKSVGNYSDTQITNNEQVVGGYYIVRKGDTLYSIARLFGTKVARIKALNNLRSNELSIGQNLLVK